MGVPYFGQCVRKLPKNGGKELFYETYFKTSNIDRKLIFLSQNMLLIIFELKKGVCFVWGNVYKNCSKIEEKRYFTKHTLKRVISTGSPLFGPKIS